VTRTFRIAVRLFAGHRESVGASELEVEIDEGSTVEDLRSVLASHPAIGSLLGGAAVALNRRYAESHVVVSEGDEVAIIPPVAGG
jgi:molybdopterin converting factor subunit 1